MSQNKGSEITRFYKFKEFINDLAVKYSNEAKIVPMYNVDYKLEVNELGVTALTELGGKFINFMMDECLKANEC